MENGIVHQSQIAPVGALSTSQAFEPSSIAEAINLAKILVASRLLPKAVATPEAAFAIIATGRELGLTAMQSLRSIHVVEGKPTLSADLMIAIAKRAPECEYMRLAESTDLVATYETKRRGETEPTRLSWTFEQAKNAGLTGKDNWKKFPAAMLRARCAAAICRAVYPDTLLGVYETDELSPGRGVPDVEYTQVVDAQTARESDPGAQPANDIPGLMGDLLAAYANAQTIDEVRAASGRVVDARKTGRLSESQILPLRDARAAAEKRVSTEAA